MKRLRKTSPNQPGWTRRRCGRGFTYLDTEGDRLPEADVERIRGLVIPPAWRDVWICPVANGHLQAVGTDDAGRRQYLYHPDWRAKRDLEKFDRAMTLGRALPRMRRRISDDLTGGDPSRPWACALAVHLLDLGFFRIGSDAYADEHGSFGLTTLERGHLRMDGGRAVFDFAGKSGVEHTVVIEDPLALASLRRLRRRGGGFDGLLAFKDGARWTPLDAAHVNEYLAEVSPVPVSAKDFRTWHGTVLAAVALAETTEPGTSAASRKRAIKAAMDEVGEQLGNTAAVARSSYVDPRVLDRYESGETITFRGLPDDPAVRPRIEKAVLRLLG